MAAPFVQGNLVNKNISLEINSSCGHCNKPIKLEIDRNLNYQVKLGSEPLIFSPYIDWDTLKEPNIIHAY